MNKPGVHIEGMSFLKEQLVDFLPRESTAILRRTTNKIASRGRDLMRAGAPVARGVLKKAIVSKRERGSKDSIEAGIFITKGRGAKHDAYHWHWQEFGTQHHEAQPFIAPAFEELRADYPRIFEEEFGRQIEKQLEKRAKAQRGGG